MHDKERLDFLNSRNLPFLEAFSSEILTFQSIPPELNMQFEVTKEFCHSKGTIVQGGFVTVMLDVPMAHLVIGITEGKINPLTLDINISFLAPSRPGKFVCKAKVIKLGKKTGFLSSELFQEESLVAISSSTVMLVQTSET